MEAKETQELLIPTRLVSPVDLSRIVRELANLDDALHQAGLRKGGNPVGLPKTSRILEELAAVNQLSLLDSSHRANLAERLQQFQENAPTIHMSLTVEPSGPFIEKMITWLRQNIKPNILLDIGLQPTITAGCVIRTPNKVFDMSLRHNLIEKSPILLQKIGEQA